MSLLRRGVLPVRSAFLPPSPFVSLRRFSKPSSPNSSAEDETRHRAAYEKHRVEVDPKLAGIDENMTFEHPKVRHQTPLPLSPLSDVED